MGNFWWVGVATFAFLVNCCSSFCVPALRSRWPVGPPRLLKASGFSDKSTARATTHWMAKKYQALVSSSEADEFPKANNGSSPHEEDGALSDDPAPSTPNILWWTESRTEEDAAFNRVVNAGFISSVVLFAIVTIFTIDTEISRGWTAGEVILRIPVDNWLAYTSVLRDNPVLVKACTSGIVYTLGDWTAQTFEGTALESIKRDRVARSAVAGLLLHGPLSHVWYDLCERMFDFIDWNDFWWVAAPKVVVDQILWGPFWNAVYIWFVGTLKGDSFETNREAVVTTALPLVIAGIRLWPLAHLVTYGVIPTENRLLWVDFVEIIWVTILSRQAAEQARANDEPDGESAAAGEVQEEAGT